MRGRDRFLAFKRPALVVLFCVAVLIAGVFVETFSAGRLVAAQEHKQQPMLETPHTSPSENRPSFDARSAPALDPKAHVDAANIDADAAIPPLGALLKTILGGGAPKPALPTIAPPPAAALPPVAPAPGPESSGSAPGALLPPPVPLPEVTAILPAAAPAATESSRPKLGLLGGLGGLLDTVLNPKDGVVASVISAVGNILPIPANVSIVLPAVDAILDTANTALQLDNATSVAGAVLGAIADIVTGVETTLNGVVGGVANSVDGLVENVADGAVAGLGVPMPDTGVLHAVADVLKSIPGEIQDTLQAVHGTLGNLPLDSVLPNVIDGVVDSLGGTLNGVFDAVDNLVCTVEQIGVVSGLLQIPCSQVTFSVSDASLATQGTLSIVVTTPGNLLATVTDSAGSTLLPTLAAMESLMSLASSAGPSIPTNPAALPASVPGSGPSSAPSAPAAGTPPAAVSSTAALSTSLPLPVVPTPPLAPSAPVSVVTVTQVIASCPAITPSAPVGCPAPPPCPSCPAAACNCPPELPLFDPALGPCPGEGYTCSSCDNGWFCPPKNVPARACPCGFGWPCEDCTGGWFCAPVQISSVQIINVCPASSVAPVSAAAPASPTTPAATPSAQPTLALPKGKYAGCYLDTPDRALNGSRFTAVPPGHTLSNAICLDICLEAGFRVAGTENGAECYCGNYLFNTYMLDDSACHTPCTGNMPDACGGPWALAVYSPDGLVDVRQPEFVLTEPPPGTPETSLHVGGVRQTVIPMTVPVYAWPPPIRIDSLLPLSIDTAGLISAVASMVEEVVSKASSIESDILSRAPADLGGPDSILGEGLMSLTSDVRSFVSAVATVIPILPTMPGPAMPAMTTPAVAPAPAAPPGGAAVVGSPSVPGFGGSVPGNPVVLPLLDVPFYGRMNKEATNDPPNDGNSDHHRHGDHINDMTPSDPDVMSAFGPGDQSETRKMRFPRRRS